MPANILNISKEEWAQAKAHFAENKQEIKWSRQISGLTHSFIKIEGEIFAMGLHDNYRGTGNFAAVKVAQDEKGNNYALKIEGERKNPNRLEAIEVMKALGLWKGGAIRDYTGHKLWLEKAIIEQKRYGLHVLCEGIDLHLHLVQLQEEPRKPYGFDNGPNRIDYAKQSLTERLVIALNISASLQKIQKLRIVHSDLKPSNMVLADDFTVGIVDYGGAKRLGEKEELRVAEYTDLFAAPTVLDEKCINLTTDIFAIGEIFELMGLDDPFIATMRGLEENRPTIAKVIAHLQDRLHNAPSLRDFAKNPLVAAILATPKKGFKGAIAVMPGLQGQVALKKRATPVPPKAKEPDMNAMMAQFRQGLKVHDPKDPLVQKLQGIVDGAGPDEELDAKLARIRKKLQATPTPPAVKRAAAPAVQPAAPAVKPPAAPVVKPPVAPAVKKPAAPAKPPAVVAPINAVVPALVPQQNALIAFKPTNNEPLEALRAYVAQKEKDSLVVRAFLRCQRAFGKLSNPFKNEAEVDAFLKANPKEWQMAEQLMLKKAEVKAQRKQSKP
jgi:serine/threonine protein kinase